MKRGKNTRLTLLCVLVSTVVLLNITGNRVSSVADRSLSLSVDKPVYSLGEIVTITVDIQAEKCRDHGHFLDIYIYNSMGFLIHRVYLEAAPEIAIMPWNFPVKISFTPREVDVYTVKLWVEHSTMSRHWFLEDTITFRVVPYVTSTTQVTLTPTTSSIVVTITIVTTTTTRAIVTVTTAEMQLVEFDWTTVSMLLILVAVALLVFGAYELGKRRASLGRASQAP